MSHAAGQVLVSAVDHFETLRLVAQEQQTITARGVFTLVRAALENAAVAVWLLAPDDRDERVVRLLRWEWADNEDDFAIASLMDTMLENGGRQAEASDAATVRREARRRELQDLGRAAGLAQDLINQIARRPGWAQIVGEAGHSADGLTRERALWAWRVCSGLAHSRRWALAFLDREVTAAPAEAAHDVRISATERQLVVVVNIATAMVTEGWRLYDDRRQPSR